VHRLELEVVVSADAASNPFHVATVAYCFSDAMFGFRVELSYPPFRGGSGLRASSLSSFGAVHKIRIVSIQLVYILYIVYLVRLCVCGASKIDFFYI
jgi:hypothetical protein